MNKVLKRVITSFTFIFLNSILWAWYPQNGIPISIAGYESSSPKIVTDGSGGAIMIWQVAHQSTVNVQRVNNIGSTLWTTNGVALPVSSLPQFMQAIPDGNGGVIIAWEQEGVGPFRIYGQHVNSEGSTLWAANGVQLSKSTTSLEQYFPAIVTDGSGGVIVSWYDANTSTSGIYVQHVNSEGSTLWDTDVLVCSGSGDYTNIASDGAGGAIIEGASGIGGDVLLQRVNSEGSTLWVYGGITTGKILAGIHTLPMVSDGSGGVIISGLYRSLFITTTIFIQRVDSTGSTLWGTNGVSVDTMDMYMSNQQLLSDGNGGAFMVWNYNRQGNGDNVYIQRVDSNGSTHWTESGIGLCTVTSDQNFPQIVSDGESGAIIAWSDNRDDVNRFDVYVQRINSEGSTLWANNGIAICTTDQPTNTRNYPQIVSDDLGGAILDWVDSRNGILTGPDIYAQQVDNSGNSPGTLFTAHPNVAADTSQWVYENAPNTNSRPDVSYLSSYSGVSGVIDLAFTVPNQGIKMTLGRSNWQNLAGGQWYKVRMKVISDVTNNTFVSEVFIYDNESQNPFDVSADVLLSTPTTWTWMETALYCESVSSVYSQVMMKNGNSTGNMYISEVDIVQSIPKINLVSNSLIANSSGDWDNATESSGWAIEVTPNSSMASYDITGSTLNISFANGVTQGLKFTGKTGAGLTLTSQVTVGNNVGMKMNISSSGVLNNPIALLAVYGTDVPNSLSFKELGATATVGKLPSSGQLETAIESSQPYIFGQFQVRNSAQATLVVDNTYLEADISP